MVKKVLVSLATIFLAGILAAESLPSGFRKIKFGMNVDEVKSALKKDPDFGYRGDRDVSLLPGENRMLIETDSTKLAPYSYFERCWFQFNEDKLYTITVNLKRPKLDHHSVYTSLVKKYGNPVSLDPEKAEWSDADTIMTLERPLTLKYTDRKVFEELQSKAMVRKSAEETERDKFLDSL